MNRFIPARTLALNHKGFRRPAPFGWTRSSAPAIIQLLQHDGAVGCDFGKNRIIPSTSQRQIHHMQHHCRHVFHDGDFIPFPCNLANSIVNSSWGTHRRHLAVEAQRRFSTHKNNESSPSSSPQTSSSSTMTSSTSLFQKLRKKVRNFYRRNDEKPRAIQEKNEIYWILLSIAHRDLRLEHQRDLPQQSTPRGGVSKTTWNHVSQEVNHELTDKAATALDETNDLSEMTLTHLRREMQKTLEPQVMDLLSVACTVEEIMLRNAERDQQQADENGGVAEAGDGSKDEENGDEDIDEYIFSEREAEEYRSILLQEYHDVCASLKKLEMKGDNINAELGMHRSIPFLTMKKNAISTLLTYFQWWTDNSHPSEVDDGKRAIASKPSQNGEVDPTSESWIDEFGFRPNQAEEDVLSGMRYYHVRNMIRAYYVRNPRSSLGRISDDTSNNDDSKNHSYPSATNANRTRNYYHTLQTLKSTIPGAGRGVYLDGFAPAGTLLAFFPGKVWPKEHLASASLQTQMQLSVNPRHQLSMRYDDILIDSRKSPYTVMDNLWAVGHIVNHPPKPESSGKNVEEIIPTAESNDDIGEELMDNNPRHKEYMIGPNCMTVTINFTLRMLQELQEREQHPDLKMIQSYIPNEYELPPKQWAQNAFEEKVVMHGMGLIALKDVKDEELFYDYRLSPDLESRGSDNTKMYPAWYHVWDEESLKNRWEVDA
mmetsp:Transcript_20398/g.42783  ORF Transcript_20398/g.42783 Transcript_20398/m.42783 type:complete len:711 (-) Transcript_20398:150-2282(-)